jgi:hypothetical protein
MTLASLDSHPRQGKRLSSGLSWARALAVLLSVALGTLGCAGYKLGPTNGLAAGEKSVQIAPFANNTLEPRLTDAVTLGLRKELQRDGTYRLATHDDGDIIVTGRITRYDRRAISFTHSDVITVQDYHVRLEARVTAQERNGRVIFKDQPVSGFTLMRVGPDLTSSERQALPLLADDLARNVTALLADGTW